MWEYNYTPSSDELYHHGIKGQKWGVRRYKNKDGSLTPAGKKRYASKEATRKYYDDIEKATEKAYSQNDNTSAYYMRLNTNRGKTYVSGILSGAANGMLTAGLVSLVKREKGSAAIKRLAKGGLLGASFGTLGTMSNLGKGKIIAETSYGVKPYHERYSEEKKKMGISD